MGNRRSHPAVVSYEEALDGLDADTLSKVNQLFAFLKDKRDGISGHVFWKDLLQIGRVNGATAISVDTLWRLFVAFNYRGGGYLSYREFVAACYVLVKQEARLKQNLVFVAFCEDRGVHGRMTTPDLKSLLLELIVGNRTSEWRAYPRQNITMNDFEPLVTLMAEAAIAKVSCKERGACATAAAGTGRGWGGGGGGDTTAAGGSGGGGGGTSGSSGGGGRGGSGSSVTHDQPGGGGGGGDGPGAATASPLSMSMDLEGWHKFAATQRQVQNLVAVLNAAGTGIRDGSVLAPDDQSDFEV